MLSNMNWNNVRQAVYVLGAGILGAAASMGWISADQGDALGEALTQVLGAVALIVAAANTNKGGPPAPAAIPAATSAPEGLPVYDGPTSADDGYVGRHRLDT